MHLEEIYKLLENPKEEDKQLLEKAYHFSEKAHEGQKRLSGEPYFTHIIEVVKILASLKMSPTTIAAGFLHDTIEDKVATEEQIKKEFGDEILFLVKGVTKLDKVKYQGSERHIESLRKFFVATAEDLRIVIIKFADRLHNMRTLASLPPEKQKRIALETLEMYAPLADRLSMRIVAREMEDLAFKFAYPKEYQDTVNLLQSKEKESLPYLEKFTKEVKKALAKEGVVVFKTDFREKGIYSLYKKLRRNSNDIEKVYDILAVRIYVNTIADCYKVLGIIHGLWRPLPGRIKDYIAYPKPNGYQSLHTTVLSGDGAIIEVQIRTNEMHYNAEYGIASHITYKKSGGSHAKKMDTESSWFKQFLPKMIDYADKDAKNGAEIIPGWMKELAEMQKNIKTAEEKEAFINDLKADFFSERIFVLTPKGDVIDLPRDSKVLDFAYAIHSKVGDHTNGAKINGKMVALDTVLNNGDIVEIATKESAKPSSKWLEMVKTNMAKRHIANSLEKLKRKGL
jgi:GTP pyrophosphokinase